MGPKPTFLLRFVAGRQLGLWEAFSLGEKELGYILGFINLVHGVFLGFGEGHEGHATHQVMLLTKCQKHHGRWLQEKNSASMRTTSVHPPLPPA